MQTVVAFQFEDCEVHRLGGAIQESSAAPYRSDYRIIGSGDSARDAAADAIESLSLRGAYFSPNMLVWLDAALLGLSDTDDAHDACPPCCGDQTNCEHDVDDGLDQDCRSYHYVALYVQYEGGSA